jgi:DNA polymerase-3 subunit alpha (Gram-positive type)
MEGNLEGTVQFGNRFVKELWSKVKPQSFDDMLRLIGLAHSTNIWRGNADGMYEERRMSFDEIPAFREDLFDMISDRLYRRGIYDNGLAYEVTEKARRGYYARVGGMDEETMLALLEIGVEQKYIFLIENVNYMFPKAHGVAYLRDAIRMMYYRTHYKKEYDKIILGK